VSEKSLGEITFLSDSQAIAVSTLAVRSKSENELGLKQSTKER
jgi:hypothetical protein